jgi:hypothetical protein
MQDVVVRNSCGRRRRLCLPTRFRPSQCGYARHPAFSRSSPALSDGWNWLAREADLRSRAAVTQDGCVKLLQPLERRGVVRRGGVGALGHAL